MSSQLESIHGTLTIKKTREKLSEHKIEKKGFPNKLKKKKRI